MTIEKEYMESNNMKANNIEKRLDINNILDYSLCIIIFTLMMDKSPIKIMGSNLRIYQIASVPFIFGIAWLWYKKKMSIKLDKFFIVCILWYGFLILSGVNTIFVRQYIKTILGQGYLFILSFTIYVYLLNKDRNYYKKIYSLFIHGLMIGVIIGVLQFFSFVILGVNIGVTHLGGGLVRPVGLMTETNWYSLVCIMVAIPIMVQLFMKKYFVNKYINFIYFTLSISGMIMSMTRTAFLAFAVVYCIVFILLKYNKDMIKVATLLLVLICIAFTMFYFIDSDSAIKYINRLNPFTTAKTDGGALTSRSGTLELSKDRFIEHPVIGNGAGTIGVLASTEEMRMKYVAGGELNVIAAGPNILVNAFYESGILGGCTFIILIYILFNNLIIEYKKNYLSIEIVIGISIISGILIFSLYNNAIRFGLFWILISIVKSFMDNRYVNNKEVEK